MYESHTHVWKVRADYVSHQMVSHRPISRRKEEPVELEIRVFDPLEVQD